MTTTTFPEAGTGSLPGSAILPEQTPKRRKVTKRWEKFRGLTAAQLASAQAVIDDLQGNPAMRRIGWEEMLGSNEWKFQRWTSLTTGRVSCVEIIIGEAVPA